MTRERDLNQVCDVRVAYWHLLSKECEETFYNIEIQSVHSFFIQTKVMSMDNEGI